VGSIFDEILRATDSLHLSNDYKVATPVNWKFSDPVIITPSIFDADAAKTHPQEYAKIDPCL
jgi:alkyl hydroperoxide reductase subunit AhpC